MNTKSDVSAVHRFGELEEIMADEMKQMAGKLGKVGDEVHYRNSIDQYMVLFNGLMEKLKDLASATLQTNPIYLFWQVQN